MKKHNHQLFSIPLTDFVLYGMLFMVMLFFIRGEGYSFDVDIWVRWATYIYANGLNSIYELPDNNYNPVFHYIFWLYGKLAGSICNIDAYRNFLKGFTLLFDFAGAIVAAKLVQKQKNRFKASLLILLNVAYLYNTLIWQQIDAVFTTLAFISIFLSMKGKVAWGSVFIILALNTKPQAIIFLPVLLLLWLPVFFHELRSIGKVFITAVLAQFILLIPFLFGQKNHWDRLLAINLNAVDYIPYISINAFNVWVFLHPGIALNNLPDSLPLAGLTYKAWGLIMFFIISAIILFPLLIITLRNLLCRIDFQEVQYPQILLSCGLVAIAFCFFNTQMHERYWHPAILFLGAYALISRNYLAYFLVSCAYFLNLEFLLRFLKLQNYNILPFNIRLIAGLFLLSLIYGIWQLYKQVPWSQYFGDLKASGSLYDMKPRVLK